MNALCERRREATAFKRRRAVRRTLAGHRQDVGRASARGLSSGGAGMHEPPRAGCLPAAHHPSLVAVANAAADDIVVVVVADATATATATGAGADADAGAGAGPGRVGVATTAALAAATIRSPPRHPRGESVLYYKS
ncbi:hypothetical protein GA845_27480 [Burkholderia pseudomallei]|nr:hypothetical protein [Burkholderia pseudomallei]